MTKRKLFIEPPKLGVKRGYKPFKHEGLSGVTVLHDDHGVGYAYIQFGDKFLDHVARKMPRGVGPAEQAYIHVQQMIDLWAVYGVYLEDDKHVLLWRQKDCPDWIGYIKRTSIS